jgi:hypothetical protein
MIAHASSSSDASFWPAPIPLPTAAEAQPLEYYRPAPQVPGWIILTRLPTITQWHQAKTALQRGNITCRMGDGAENDAAGGIGLLVMPADASRGAAILEFIKSGKDWCPRCGCKLLQILPLPWWWPILAAAFLGVPPFYPKRFACKQCAHRWA